MANKPKGQLKGIHHFYIGIAIKIIAFILGFVQGDVLTFWKWYIVGTAIEVDDACQHFLGWKTPLAMANDWLWEHSGVYRWACQLFDKILGKG